MSKQTISIRPNNHRVHPCQSAQKLALINVLISKNEDKKITLISTDANAMLQENIKAENVSILSDKEFITNQDLSCELLISYDLADSPQIYIARVSKATKMALVLLDPSESQKLYDVETLLGRVLKNEIVEGFEPKVQKQEKPRTSTKKMSQEEIKKVAKKRYEEKTFDKPKKEFDTPKKSFDKPKKDFKKDFKKSSDKFSDKDRKENTYKKPKKVGKKITIKARKKPSED